VIESIPSTLDGERLDRVVAILTGASRSEAAAAVAAGQVSVDGDTVTFGKQRVHDGDEIEITGEVGLPPEAPAADANVEITIVHVDDDVIVVDKAADLVVHPGSGIHDGTLVNGLLARFPEIAHVGQRERPGIVHRLDRGTTGLLMVARTPLAYDSLVAQLAERRAKRRYQAIVCGVPDSASGLIDAPLGRSVRDRARMTVTVQGREARTRYEVVEAFARPLPSALVTCDLETGRTHQIRVHLAAIGHPVLGDARYHGHRGELVVERPMLHAASLTFEHPSTGEVMTFDSPRPADFIAVLNNLSPAEPI